MSILVGDLGNASFATNVFGSGCKINNWMMDLDFGAMDVSGFGDKGYTDAIGTLCTASGSVSGFLDSAAAPIPAAVLAAAFAPATCIAALTLTMATTKSYSFSALVSRVRIDTPYRKGAAIGISFDFISKGPITQTWTG